MLTDFLTVLISSSLEKYLIKWQGVMKVEKSRSSNANEETQKVESRKSPTLETNDVTENFLKVNPQFLRSVTLLKKNCGTTVEPQKLKRKVKIRKPVSPTKKQEEIRNKKRVLVARKVRDDEEESIGRITTAETPRKNDGIIKPYQILGTVEDFLLEASKDSLIISHDSIDENKNILHNASISSDETSTRKMSGRGKDETKALENWSMKLEERKKLQKHLAKKMNVDEDMLLLNQSEQFREIQEERILIDRAMPSKNYGKGYRAGSEFWKQTEEVRNDVSITLKQTEKGKIPPIQHIGTPAHVKDFTGFPWSKTRRMLSVHYPWSQSAYLEERKQELGDIMKELDPFIPDFEGLEVIGNKLDVHKEVDTTALNTHESIEESDLYNEENELTTRDPLERFEDVIPEPIFGPSLIMNGQVANWEGSFDPTNQDTVGVITRLFFETEIEQCVESSIVLTNNGTTTLYYQWKKEEMIDHFGLKPSTSLKRFYFDMCGGSILPGDTVTIHFHFKSSQPGMFKEVYNIDTRPILMCGKKLQVVLKGRASKEDTNQVEREKIEEFLVQKQKETMIGRIVKDIMNGIVTPPRPITPPNHYATEEELFELANNNMLAFHSDVVSRLKTLHSEATNEDKDLVWNLQLDTLRKTVLSCEEDDEKEKYLGELNSNMLLLSSKRFQPVQQSHYKACYQIICEAIDKIVDKASMLRQKFNLPEREFVVKQEVAAKKPLKKQLVNEAHANNRSRADSRGKKERSGSPNRKTPLKEKAKDKAAENLVKPESSDVIQSQTTVDGSQNQINTHQNPRYSAYVMLFKTQVYTVLGDTAVAMETVLSE